MRSSHGIALVLLTSIRLAVGAEEISYNRDIRPILVEHCFGCHGADSAARKADLRLDQRDSAVESGAIVPGEPDSSAMLDRIFADDPDEVMPPSTTKKALTTPQKDLLVAWIEAGAAYEPHWAFIPPVRPAAPAVQDAAWVRNPIDRFILARLEQDGLAPAPEADRHALARRVALDLTGLPPEPADVDAFVADARPDAYERLVDALLARPEWGEHRGRHWLDYARYADTHGIHFDNEREMWIYREWVIDAFNDNLPFDRFTILQLAGDLVAKQLEDADAVLDVQTASGFNRCNMTTNEGGVIPEEYLVLYARDRTETTAAVWMGLTAGCAVCHDHKFDPLSQREFYELSAFFTNTTQAAKDGNVKDTPPIVVVPTRADRERFVGLERARLAATRTADKRKAAVRPAFDAWIRAADAGTVAALLPQDPPVVEWPLAEGTGNTTRWRFDGEWRDGPLSAATTWRSGPNGAAALLLDGKACEVADGYDLEHDQAFTASFWLRAPAGDSGYAVIARMNDTVAYRGWDVWVQDRRVGMHLVHTWPGDALKVLAASQLKTDRWTLVSVAYDGSGKAAGVSVYYDGKRQKPRIDKDTFKGNTIRSDVPFTIGGRIHGKAAHGAGLAGLMIWNRALAPAEIEAAGRARALAGIVKLPEHERPKAAAKLYDWWLRSHDESFRSATAEIARLDAERNAIRQRGTVAHVMHEKDEAARAHVLDRGEYDKRKDEVRPDTPDILPAFAPDLPRNRLGLAKWLLLGEHPLTARVAVNRFWQEVFGAGLVRTSGDFGTTGELPSHPELLDWLAVEFRESGWDVKRLFRLMVTSAAYRQSAAATPEKLQLDNANRLLSRGPRFRMDAEMIRDQALAASGLLVRKRGGPSVKPYQPDGVWEAVAIDLSNTARYQRDSGENLYRRSLYTFWKRSAPPASMEIFNAPSRELCCVRRERTNTPLQALVTLNDPQFVEAARTLADRALAAAADDGARIDFLSRHLLARPLASDERAIVTRSLTDLSAWYAAHPDEAAKLVAVGESRPETADVSLLAAWTMLASELLNLDEALCK
ncbi:MAG: DUF1553 domain-containing protein [Planctomycetaceae bacterium]